MISTFHRTPLARGQGLCAIDKVYLGVTQKSFIKTESPSRAELDRFFVK